MRIVGFASGGKSLICRTEVWFCATDLDELEVDGLHVVLGVLLVTVNQVLDCWFAGGGLRRHAVR